MRTALFLLTCVGEFFALATIFAGAAILSIVLFGVL